MVTANRILFKMCLANVLQITTRPASVFAFFNIPRSHMPAKVIDSNRNTYFVSLASGKDDDLLLDAEDLAAFDAHDLSDPGMEAAAMERAVMMAEEFKNKKSEMKETSTSNQPATEANASTKSEGKTDDDDSLLDAEDAAAFDAHDLSDPGMEAAAMERAVMMAEEFKSNHAKKRDSAVPKQTNTETKKTVSLEATGDDDSLLDAEDAAAFDAHDLSDPGMEAAAMERAVMMAEELKINQALKMSSAAPKPPKQTPAETKKTKSLNAQTDDDDSLLDAEDAAAFDAHDLSDPGMEAAAMERAVMIAEEMKKKRKKTE